MGRYSFRLRKIPRQISYRRPVNDLLIIAPENGGLQPGHSIQNGPDAYFPGFPFHPEALALWREHRGDFGDLAGDHHHALPQPGDKIVCISHSGRLLLRLLRFPVGLRARGSSGARDTYRYGPLGTRRRHGHPTAYSAYDVRYCTDALGINVLDRPPARKEADGEQKS